MTTLGLDGGNGRSCHDTFGILAIIDGHWVGGAIPCPYNSMNGGSFMYSSLPFGSYFGPTNVVLNSYLSRLDEIVDQSEIDLAQKKTNLAMSEIKISKISGYKMSDGCYLVGRLFY